MNQIVNHDHTGPSPFDAIRQTREDGTEFWSARDLQTLAGYDRWERFEDAIDRAMTSSRNQGHDPADHFRGAAKMVELGSGAVREVRDYHLTRFGCYLVFQNGDPRKAQIAGAQGYFAIRTREAETAAPKQVSGPELMARALLEAAETIKAADLARDLAIKEREAARDYVRELEPKADTWDAICSGKGDLTITDAAKILCRAGIETGPRKLHQQMLALGWIYQNARGKWIAKQDQLNAKTLAERARHYIDDDGVSTLATPQIRVTAKGLDRLRVILADQPALEVAQ